MKMPIIVGIFIFISKKKISQLVNMKIVGIFIFISRENFMLSWAKHDKVL